MNPGLALRQWFAGRRGEAMLTGLRRRLLVMLIVPLVLLALMSMWLDYRSAGNVAAEQDQRLASLVPLLADSILDGGGREAGEKPLLLLAPAMEDFAKRDRAAYAVFDADGASLAGEAWLSGPLPTSPDAVFNTEERDGGSWRILRQRVPTASGDVVLALADGADPRQQWARAVLLKVLLPNLVLLAAAAWAVRWAVARALRPLLDLREAVEHRSPRDLSPLPEDASPEEVRPLVRSLNRLFGLVNAQVEGQRRFVADAAHQLRTPLAGLQSQVEAWAQTARTAPGVATSAAGELRLPAAELEKLRGATRRTSQLATQLLALSRADARANEAVPRERVDLDALCHDMLESHLDAATARRIDLGLDTAPADALGHEWLLREAIGNLVDNAVKYVPEGGTVTIRCGPDASVDGRRHVFVEVEDDGPGVPPAERSRVLERFHRVPGTRGEGAGLGLAIAEEIARVHGTHLVLTPSVEPDRAGPPDRTPGLKVRMALPAG